ncbi:MAG: hypothetical protein PVF17_02125 [Ignavibacteria bacterium]
MNDSDFLLTKAKIINKVQKLMELTREELVQFVNSSNYSFPEGIDLTTGKISRGENYLNLPYMVLDYPAYFKAENIFAFRTMFWWGNFFSSTLHLEGDSLEKAREKLSAKIEELTGKQVYICTGETPWQYHYGKDNYEILTQDHFDFINKCRLLKISKKIDINDWKILPQFSRDFLELLLNYL